MLIVNTKKYGYSEEYGIIIKKKNYKEEEKMEMHNNTELKNSPNKSLMVLWAFLIMLIHMIALVIGQMISLIIYMIIDVANGTLGIGDGVFTYEGNHIGVLDLTYLYSAKSVVLSVIIATPIVLMAVYLIYVRLLKEKEVLLMSANGKSTINTILGFLAGIAIWFPITFIVSNTFIGNLSEEHTRIMNDALDMTPLWLSIIGVAIFAPIIEEIAYRGIVQGFLEKMIRNPFIVILIQALLFGVVHMNLQQFIYAAGVGLILGLIRYWTKSIWPCILAHISFNLSGLIIYRVNPDLSGQTFLIISAISLFTSNLALQSSVPCKMSEKESAVIVS